MRAVHWLPKDSLVTGCGRDAAIVELADFFDEVTCKSCLSVSIAESKRGHDGAPRPVERVVEPVKAAPVPPMNRAEKRKRARQLRSAGVDPDVMFVRYDLTPEYLEGPDLESPIEWLDLVMHHVDTGIRALLEEGADVRQGAIVTIGDHPRNPGGISIEVKSKPRAR